MTSAACYVRGRLELVDGLLGVLDALRYQAPPRRVCDTCDGLTSPTGACDVCRALAAVAARRDLIEDVEHLIGTDWPTSIARRLGYNQPASLARRLIRYGRPDLARPFERTQQDTRNPLRAAS
ncbi:MAG: hypothetical protein ACRCYU_08175 [Nocardioides sp.]